MPLQSSYSSQPEMFTLKVFTTIVNFGVNGISTAKLTGGKVYRWCFWFLMVASQSSSFSNVKEGRLELPLTTALLFNCLTIDCWILGSTMKVISRIVKDILADDCYAVLTKNVIRSMNIAPKIILLLPRLSRRIMLYNLVIFHLHSNLSDF